MSIPKFTFQSIKVLNTTSKCFISNVSVKPISFPTIKKSSAVFSSDLPENRKYAVVISSDSDEVETVCDHIRV